MTKKIKFGPKLLVAAQSALTILALAGTSVYAVDTGTQTISMFVTFICDWLKVIGGLVALIGGVMFALGWQREDAEGKSRGLMTLMAGFMVVAIGSSPSIFGITV